MPSGYDDNMTVWQAQLPVQVKAGAFTGKFQIGYGKNINAYAGESVFSEVSTGKREALRIPKGITGFVDLGFAAGPVTPHLYFGYDRAKTAMPGRWATTTTPGWLTAPTFGGRFTDSFYVIPEFTYYDYGKKPNTVGKPGHWQ